jgi:hypothetical protein
MKIKHIILLVVSAFLFLSCIGEQDSIPQIQQWHPHTISFEGPNTSEYSSENPFVQYVLLVEFEHKETTKVIRGFYAADGNAAETSADSGSVWQVRFNPEHLGEWKYSASLFKGDSIAISQNIESAEEITLPNNKGMFEVVPSQKKAPDFRSQGRMIADNGYFRFEHSGNYFLKAGADSPENFLAFKDFDNTYRMEALNKDGEAKTTGEIHFYEPHVQDWNPGDPTWQNGKGKAIIGATNYLASKGMNAIYFLTLNIKGDGKDVWMYRSTDDFFRFDVSKLQQWEILFQHMQSKGIMLHVVLQETENETMLDGGDMGPARKLYFQELIARFGHHNALIWNLGEENGPAPWVGTGAQTDAQRKAAATYIKKNDPFNHPVIIHTLPNEDLREPVLNSLLGFTDLDGISLQHHDREDAAEVVMDLKEKSMNAGHEWLVTMDEIGMWHTGAKVDSADPNHPSLTHLVLWGTLLSGSAGVEWYFGANSPQNDLTSEDWRQRDQLWEITNHAKIFFEEYLNYWEMKPDHGLIDKPKSFCLAKHNEIYAAYIPNYSQATIDMSKASGDFDLFWYDPLQGGALQTGSLTQIPGGSKQDLGSPPSKIKNDWVVLIRKR